MKRLRNVFRLTPRELLRSLEALLLLTGAWLAVRLLPFRWYGVLMGRRGAPTATAAATADADAGDAHAQHVAHAVRRALRRGVKHLPWRSTCLMRALAAQVMLRRRGCGGTVYLGAERREDVGFSFHAWIRAGGVWVSGGMEAGRFTVIATFR